MLEITLLLTFSLAITGFLCTIYYRIGRIETTIKYICEKIESLTKDQRDKDP